jgi:hypothetical protein
VPGLPKNVGALSGHRARCVLAELGSGEDLNRSLARLPIVARGQRAHDRHQHSLRHVRLASGREQSVGGPLVIERAEPPQRLPPDRELHARRGQREERVQGMVPRPRHHQHMAGAQPLLGRRGRIQGNRSLATNVVHSCVGRLSLALVVLSVGGQQGSE